MALISIGKLFQSLQPLYLILLLLNSVFTEWIYSIFVSSFWDCWLRDGTTQCNAA